MSELQEIGTAPRDLRDLKDVIEYNQAISNTVKQGPAQWRVASHLFSNLIHGALQASLVTYNAAIHACGKWPMALALLEDLEKHEMQGNHITYGAAMSSCEKSGEWTVALVLLQAMKNVDLQPNTIVFNSTLSACAKGGLIQLKLFCVGWGGCPFDVSL